MKFNCLWTPLRVHSYSLSDQRDAIKYVQRGSVKGVQKGGIRPVQRDSIETAKGSSTQNAPNEITKTAGCDSTDQSVKDIFQMPKRLLTAMVELN